MKELLRVGIQKHVEEPGHEQITSTVIFCTGVKAGTWYQHCIEEVLVKVKIWTESQQRQHNRRHPQPCAHTGCQTNTQTNEQRLKQPHMSTEKYTSTYKHINLTITHDGILMFKWLSCLSSLPPSFPPAFPPSYPPSLLPFLPPTLLSSFISCLTLILYDAQPDLTHKTN